MAKQTNSSSFQAVLASQGKKTYAIFTYKCGLLDWNRTNVLVGFSASNTLFAKFPLSRQLQPSIDCFSSQTSNWSNIAYEIGSCMYEFLVDFLSIQDVATSLVIVDLGKS